jgi:hypothetical protein
VVDGDVERVWVTFTYFTYPRDWWCKKVAAETVGARPVVWMVP